MSHLLFRAAEQSLQSMNYQACQQDDDQYKHDGYSSRHVRMARGQPSQADGKDIFSETEADV